MNTYEWEWEKCTFHVAACTVLKLPYILDLFTSLVCNVPGFLHSMWPNYAPLYIWSMTIQYKGHFYVLSLIPDEYSSSCSMTVLLIHFTLMQLVDKQCKWLEISTSKLATCTKMSTLSAVAQEITIISLEISISILDAVTPPPPDGALSQTSYVRPFSYCAKGENARFRHDRYFHHVLTECMFVRVESQDVHICCGVLHHFWWNAVIRRNMRDAFPKTSFPPMTKCYERGLLVQTTAALLLW